MGSALRRLVLAIFLIGCVVFLRWLNAAVQSSPVQAPASPQSPAAGSVANPPSPSVETRSPEGGTH
ncbi:MAG: hypothetical protein AB1646_02680 [Thermodesulfobacteriota bacterium]